MSRTTVFLHDLRALVPPPRHHGDDLAVVVRPDPRRTALLLAVLVLLVAGLAAGLVLTLTGSPGQPTAPGRSFPHGWLLPAFFHVR